MRITSLSARKIKASNGVPTIQVIVNKRKAASPTGESRGKHATPEYHQDIQWNIDAINHFTELKSLEIKSFNDLKKVESEIVNKFNLEDVKQFGANALFALESAILKALANENKKPLWALINPDAKDLPIPLGNAIGGGVHVHNRDAPEFQEFLLIPQTQSAKQNIILMTKIHALLKKEIKPLGKGAEGEWQSSLSNEEILDVLNKFPSIKIGLDIAASSFYEFSNYKYKDKTLSPQDQIKYLNDLIKKYKIKYVEDPLYEEDFQGFSKINKNTLVTGDDLTVSQIPRLKKAIKEKSINCMIIKPNQNGSLIEIKKIFDLCKKHKIKTVLSHRAGETLDPSLADYAVGFQADYIKAGISTKYREVKLRRLIEIEKSLR